MTLRAAGVAIKMTLTMPADTAKPDPYALWKNPNYRNYAGSWFLIAFSRRIEFIAVSVFLVKLYSDPKHESLLLGILGLVQALPVMLLAIPGGQLADRFNRLRVMTLSFSLGIVSAGGLVAVALWASDAAWWYYLLLTIGAVGWALGNPSRQAMLPNLIPTEMFSTGVAWNSSVFYIASVTGPIVGGVLVAMFDSMAPAFALVLLCRIAAIAAIMRIRYRPAVHTGQSMSWESVVAGIRFVWHTPLILATITLDLFAVLLGGVTYLLPVFAAMLHVGAVGLGVLMAADMVGAICMAVLLAHRPPLRRAGVTVLWAVAGFGAATIVFGILAVVLAFAVDDVCDRGVGQHQCRGASYAGANAHARRNARARVGGQRHLHRGLERTWRRGIGPYGVADRAGGVRCGRRGRRDRRRAGGDAHLAADPQNRLARLDSACGHRRARPRCVGGVDRGVWETVAGRSFAATKHRERRAIRTCCSTQVSSV